MNRLRLYRHSASDRAGGFAFCLRMGGRGSGRRRSKTVRSARLGMGELAVTHSFAKDANEWVTDPITRSHPEMLIAYSLVSTSVRPTTLSDLAKWAARMDDL